MRRGSALVLIVLGALIVLPAGFASAGGMTGMHGGIEMRPAQEKTEVEVPALAPTDYVEWLESRQGIETGELTTPGVEPTVIPGPSETVEVPEGG